MAKEDLTLTVMEAVPKGLSFTKDGYEELVVLTMKQLKQAKKNKWEKEDVASLYGLFYASMAGLIRSGTLVSRGTGIDGLPELYIIAGDKEYKCRESAVYGILGPEMEEILSPYEDTFASYTPDYPFRAAKEVPIIPEPEPEEEKLAPAAKKKTAKQQQQEMEALKKAQEDFDKQQAALTAAHQKEVVALKDDLRKSQSRVQFLEAQAKEKKGKIDERETEGLLAKANAEIEDLTGKLQDRDRQMKELSEKIRAESETRDQKQAEFSSEKQAYEENVKKLQEELEEAKKQASAPGESEESYYNALLPDLIRSIEGSRGDTAVRIGLLFFCLAGILLSFLLLV